MTAAATRYLPVGEAQPFDAISSVDWGRLPALVKRYPSAGARPAPEPLDTLLRNAYGFNRLQWDNWHSLPGQRGRTELSRGRALRPVPSGGGLFPAELYVTGAVPGLPRGAYHYDPAADRLDTVSTGTGLPGAGWHLVITAVLARTAFKYGEFGYRLACLDGGALAGQILGLAAATGVKAHLVDDLDDGSIGTVLGLDLDAEPVVAVIAVGAHTGPMKTDGAEPARPTARTTPPRMTARIPRATALACDSRAPTPADTAPARAAPAVPVTGDLVRLPPGPDLALTDHAGARRSLDGRFGFTALTPDQLAAVLRAGGRHPDAGATLLACVVHRVTGIGAGRYLYDPDTDTLGATGLGDLRTALSPAAGQAPLVGDHGSGVSVFVLGDYTTGLAAAGSRWYRTLNVAAGIAAHRMVLAATAVGLASRIVCAYDTARAVATLGLDGGRLRPLCQVLIGPAASTTIYCQPLELP